MIPKNQIERKCRAHTASVLARVVASSTITASNHLIRSINSCDLPAI